jgi:hypothetical protein
MVALVSTPSYAAAHAANVKIWAWFGLLQLLNTCIGLLRPTGPWQGCWYMLFGLHLFERGGQKGCDALGALDGMRTNW